MIKLISMIGRHHFGRLLCQGLAVLLAVALVDAIHPQTAEAEEGCPSGQLPSSPDPSSCMKRSAYTELPLDPSKPMVFEAVQMSMTTIFIQGIGTITADTPGRLEEFLKTSDAKMTRNIQLHSPGGDLTAGLKLGEIIRKAGYNTSIGRTMPLEGATETYTYKEAVCLAACAYAFLGGVTRSYDAKDRYGLPRPGAGGKSASGEEAERVSRIASYIERMGASQAILQQASDGSVKGDIYDVPVALGQQSRIIHDPSGEAEFRVESIKGSTVVRFDFSMREKTYRGMIRCLDRSAMLFIVDRNDSIPAELRTIKDARAEFIEGTGKTLQATASYSKSGSAGVMAFRIPEMSATSFAGDGLRLDNIFNTEIDRRLGASAGPVVRDELIDKMAWLDSVHAFAFSIKAANAQQTLPSVLQDCSNAQ